MDVIVEVASFVINFARFLLLVSSIIWLHFHPLITSYRLSPEGIDIMLLSVGKKREGDMSRRILVTLDQSPLLLKGPPQVGPQ